MKTIVYLRDIFKSVEKLSINFKNDLKKLVPRFNKLKLARIKTKKKFAKK